MNGKFKVWDSKKKYMLSKDWDFFIHQDGKLYFLSKQGINKADPWFVPVFSTGKKDRDGAELFDGDIVENVGADPHLIKWNDDGFWTCAAIKKNSYHYNGRALFHMKDEFPNIVKIGDKFKNPELLK